MSYEIKKSDIELLRNTGVSEDDIKHCIKVAEKALELAGRTGAKLDMELVGRGALLHDLGKARTHAPALSYPGSLHQISDMLGPL